MAQHPEQMPPAGLKPEALAALQAGIATILEATNAYRAALLAQDYSPTAAEAMAVEFHAMLLRSATQ